MHGQPPQSGSPSLAIFLHVALPTSVISPWPGPSFMQVISQSARLLHRQLSPLHEAVAPHEGLSFDGLATDTKQLYVAARVVSALHRKNKTANSRTRRMIPPRLFVTRAV